MAFAIEICRRASIRENTLTVSFGGRSDGTRKARLHGWRLWYTYCVESDITVQSLLLERNPAMLVADFIIALDSQGIKDYRIKEAKLAVLELSSSSFHIFKHRCRLAR